MTSLLDFIEGAHRKVLTVSGGCHNCPRRRVDFVPPTLQAGPVLWLGDIPGTTDVETGTCFSGKAGELLQSAARKAGVPEPWSFSNAVHCRPPAGTAPVPKEVSCCLSQFVLDEIADYAVVVLCGNAPLQALFPGANAAHFRGNVAWHPDFPGKRFYAIYHPNYVVRRPDLADEFQRQIDRLARIVRGEGPSAWELVRGAAALEAVRAMVQRPLLSLDFETTGLHAWEPGGRIKSLAVTADGKTVAVAHEDEPHFREIMRLLGEFVAQPQKSVLGAHIGFDLVWMEAMGYPRAMCQLIHETGALWYQAGQYKMPSLKELVARELDGYRYLVHEPHLMRDVDLLLRYNAEDVVHPLALMRKAMQKLKPKTRDLVTRVLGPADLVLTQIANNGFYVREEYRQQKIAEYEEKRQQIIAAWKDEDPEFVPTVHESGKGLSQYLFGIRALPSLSETAKGEASTDASVLKQWERDGHTIVRHLLKLRELDKILSTYLRGYDPLVGPDSRVHSTYPLTLTDTGRSSSRKPNLQNIPRKKEIRDLFGAPPGGVLVEGDLSQIEFRIMVCLAGDENGIAGYLRGEDAHTMTARTITGHYEVTKEERSRAKPVNFMFIYGGQWMTAQAIAADDYGVVWSDQEALGFRNAFMATYPRLPEYHESSKRRLIENRGWFESAVGHTFFYENWDHPNQGKRDHEFRAALNAEGQGPAAQLCFYIMALSRRMLDQRGFGAVKFVNTVHDSLLMEVPNPAWVPDVVATVNEAAAMAHNWVKSWFVVPFIMEFAAGESWGSLKEIKG